MAFKLPAVIASMRARQLKPSPVDDRTPSGWFDDGGQNNSADDDDAAIVPFMPRLIGRMGGGILSSFYPSFMTLDGPHFRVGYQGYDGVAVRNFMQAGEADSTIGKPTVMRPPIIPRRNVTPLGVRNAINFVQSMPYETWYPIIPPPVARR